MEEKAIMAQIDRIGRECGRALIPLKDFASDDRRVIGTAFLAELDGYSYLVTALHTIERFGKADCGVILWDREFSLEDRTFYFSREHDIGFFVLDEELAAVVDGVFRIPLERQLGHLERRGLGVVAIGYPFYQKLSPITPAIPVSTIRENRPLTINTKISDPLLYELLPETLTSTDGSIRLADLNPQGMSGGPVLAWTLCVIDLTPCIDYKLQSVIVEWGSDDGYLVGSAVGGLIALIDAHRQGKAPCWAD